MSLISGDIVSERSDVSGREFSTEGQTFALKPKHTPITAALIDDLSGELLVGGPSFTPPSLCVSTARLGR